MSRKFLTIENYREFLTKRDIPSPKASASASTSALSFISEKLIRKANRLQDIDKASEKNGIIWMTFARALPYFPSGILTAIGALSRMSARDYIIANLIGKFPSTALEVVIGHDVVHFRESMVRLTILVIVAAGVFCLGKKELFKKEKEPEETEHSTDEKQ